MPRAPPVAPVRNALTSRSSITVDYYALTGTSGGGAEVLSYELQWDQGPTIMDWVELVGHSTNSLLNQYTIRDPSNPSYVVAGTYYRFRYRAKNRQGWGAWSPTASIIAAEVPGQLSPLVTAMNGASVKLAWTQDDQPAYSDGG